MADAYEMLERGIERSLAPLERLTAFRAQQALSDREREFRQGEREQERQFALEQIRGQQAFAAAEAEKERGFRKTADETRYTREKELSDLDFTRREEQAAKDRRFQMGREQVGYERQKELQDRQDAKQRELVKWESAHNQRMQSLGAVQKEWERLFPSRALILDEQGTPEGGWKQVQAEVEEAGVNNVIAAVRMMSEGLGHIFAETKGVETGPKRDPQDPTATPAMEAIADATMIDPRFILEVATAAKMDFATAEREVRKIVEAVGTAESGLASIAKLIEQKNTEPTALAPVVEKHYEILKERSSQITDKTEKQALQQVLSNYSIYQASVQEASQMLSENRGYMRKAMDRWNTMQNPLRAGGDTELQAVGAETPGRAVSPQGGQTERLDLDSASKEQVDQAKAGAGGGAAAADSGVTTAPRYKGVLARAARAIGGKIPDIGTGLDAIRSAAGATAYSVYDWLIEGTGEDVSWVDALSPESKKRLLARALPAKQPATKAEAQAQMAELVAAGQDIAQSLPADSPARRQALESLGRRMVELQQITNPNPAEDTRGLKRELYLMNPEGYPQYKTVAPDPMQFQRGFPKF